jgi:predicted DNA-binding ribbon-helix-helix protein
MTEQQHSAFGGPRVASPAWHRSSANQPSFMSKPKHPVGLTSPKRSIRTAGRRIDITLEDEFWNALKEIAVSKNTSRSELVGMIDKTRSRPNLSSAVRLFVLEYYRGLANNRTVRR